MGPAVSLCDGVSSLLHGSPAPWKMLIPSHWYKNDNYQGCEALLSGRKLYLNQNFIDKLS